MKKLFFFCVILMISACTVPQKPANLSPEKGIAAQKNDEGEWDLDVLDTDYNYFLNAIAKPMSQYSESGLKARNIQLVNEWNSYYFSGLYRNIIESPISYDPQEKYGIKFEYKLYQVFAFVQWKYKLKLTGLSQTDIF